MDSFVSKIPRDYRLRVLSQLLPSAAVLDQMDIDQLRDALQARKKLERLVDGDPVRFWQPSGPGQDGFARCEDPTKTTRLFVAGNKGGKTTAGAIKFGERIYGGPLWDRDIRTTVSYPVPARGIVFAEDFDSHREVTIPTIRSWWPRGFIKRETKNPAGHIVEYGLANGSVVHFRTYEQGAFKAEGKDWDIVWCDEPPPRDLYTAIIRGLVVGNGILLISATLLKEAWIYDESEHNHVVMFEGTIHDNKWLSDRAKKAFLDSLTDDERSIRETGRPASLVGLVYKRFVDGPPFVVPLATIPPECPIIVGVDPHERKPCHIEYGYVDKDDRIIWFDWLLAGGSLTEIFNQMAAKEAQMPSRPVLCVMDPNRGSATQMDNMSWEKAFSEAGYSVVLADDNMSVGHTVLGSYLSPNDPKMLWMESCRGKFGPLYQMQRYAWDDWSRRTRMGRDKKEAPKQLYKDFPDIHRYVAISQLTFESLVMGPEVVYMHQRQRGLGGLPSIHAYN